MPNNKNRLLYSLPYLIVMLFILSITFMNPLGSKAETLTYSEFTKVLKSGEITKANVSVDYNTTTVSGMYEVNGESHNFTATIPNSESEFTEVMDALKKNSNISITDANESSVFLELLGSIIPILLFLGFGIFMLRTLNSGGGANKQAFDFSKSRARLESDIKVRFHDVAGCDEEKEEMAEIIEYLKTPRKFAKMGARIPKGILMVGSPGTGKTLLAKAVAGEANVPFYSISGSDFVEMFVGVGASRVRDMFKKAKQTAPCMIFIDEIDAVGRKRGNGVSGGHDEREQTLNQLLVEMDGFEGDEGVIVMAATNRSDVLDPALLRPGRFDRKVLVGRPDVKGREAILKVHAKNKPLAPDVDLKEVARQTPGFVGADLENVLNEAALVAARRNKTEITASDIDEAEDRVIAGPAKKDTVISPEERKRVAYHEAGHAIVGLVLSDSRTVRKVTIVPRGRAGGYNIMLPKEDENIITKKQLMEQVAGLMGGRAGEEVVVGDKSTGASNDFEQATNIARGMVTQYGMTDVGMTELESPSMQSPYGTKPYSEATAAKIDEAVKEILDEGHKQAVDIIKSHRETHKIIAEALLKYETLNEKQILSLFKTGKMPENDENEFPSESKASTYEEAKAAMEKKDQQREETENKDDKEDIHPLPDDHKNIDNIPLNPPSEKNESDDHSSDENKDD